MIAAIIILGTIAAVSVILLILLNKEIVNIANDLKQINDTETNKKINLKNKNKYLVKLVAEINKSITNSQNTEVKYKKTDMELRQAIANMSHDLRTPLTSIMGYMQLAKDESISKDEYKSYMDIIEKRSKLLQSLILSFYDMSRLQAKEYDFNLQSLNLANILCDVTADFYNDFMTKGIEPNIVIAEGMPPVIGDDRAVRRIFANLIQNALKHGSKFVDISLYKDDKYVVTTFTNNAENITDKDVELLFNRFFTADRMRTGQNTGLGLAITKSLVEQMGYSIEAKLENKNISFVIKWKNRD